MSSDGYIYVRNWDRFQYRGDRRLPWIKLYAELLDDDDYLGLSLADRGLLQDLWKLASLSGDGRVSADRVSLSRRLNVRRVSLDPLIQAGYITIRAHKRRRDGALEESESREDKKEKQDLSRNRSSRAQGTAAEDQPKNGDHPKPELPAALTRILDAKIAAQLTAAQVELVTVAWDTGIELRHSMADIEAADNPTAMLVSVARRIAGPDASPERLEQRRIAKRMGAVQRCRFLWHHGLDEGEPADQLREHLEREYRHDPSIVLEAIGAP